MVKFPKKWWAFLMVTVGLGVFLACMAGCVVDKEQVAFNAMSPQAREVYSAPDLIPFVTATEGVYDNNQGLCIIKASTKEGLLSRHAAWVSSKKVEIVSILLTDFIFEGYHLEDVIVIAYKEGSD